MLIVNSIDGKVEQVKIIYPDVPWNASHQDNPRIIIRSQNYMETIKSIAIASLRLSNT